MVGALRLFKPGAAFIFALLFLIAPSNAQQPVELELVLAIDTSTSVNDAEYELQRSGLADAFLHPQILSAIKGLGQKGMAVSIVQWAGWSEQVLARKWVLVNSKASARQFSESIRTMPRQLSGFTDIANAIRFSVMQLENNKFSGQRLAIDVSGDGTSDRNNPALARDEAILRGITINGLIIHSVEYDLGELARIELEDHYRNRVIGGLGAFLLDADNFEAFAISIRKKLYREISGPLFASK